MQGSDAAAASGSQQPAAAQPGDIQPEDVGRRQKAKKQRKPTAGAAAAAEDLVVPPGAAPPTLMEPPAPLDAFHKNTELQAAVQQLQNLTADPLRFLRPAAELLDVSCAARRLAQVCACEP